MKAEARDKGSVTLGLTARATLDAPVEVGMLVCGVWIALVKYICRFEFVRGM